MAECEGSRLCAWPGNLGRPWKQFAPPSIQFALSTRAGTDCVGHAIRAMTDAEKVYSPEQFPLQVAQCPQSPLLPFVRSIHARTTTYVWEDGAGSDTGSSKLKAVNRETRS